MGKVLWIIVGILSIAAGVLALANPLVATLTAEQIAGWGFLFVGILGMFAVFQQTSWGGRIWVLLIGLMMLLVGINLLAKPLNGVLVLTLVVASLFLVTGIFRVVLSFSLRGTGAFWLVLLSGVISVALAIMIFTNFPAALVLTLGTLLAVELISNGVSMIALSSVREATS